MHCASTSGSADKKSSISRFSDNDKCPVNQFQARVAQMANDLLVFYSGECPGHEQAEHAVADDSERVGVGEPGRTPLLDRPVNFGSHRGQERHNPAATLDMANHLNCPKVKAEATQYESDVKDTQNAQKDDLARSVHSGVDYTPEASVQAVSWP
jgi:hypothetical protein